jgi:hypothetical protein
MSGRTQDEDERRDVEGIRARRERDRMRVPRHEFDPDESTNVRHDRQLGGMERTVKRLKWWIGGIAIPAIGGIILVAKFLMTYARESERSAILREIDHDRVEHHEKMIEEISSRLRDVEAAARRNEAHLLRWRDAPSDDKTPDHKVTP